MIIPKLGEKPIPLCFLQFAFDYVLVKHEAVNVNTLVWVGYVVDVIIHINH